LGSNPRFRALYLISNGVKPGFGTEIDMYNFRFDDYDKGIRVNSYNFINYKISAFVTSVYNNLYSLKAGFEYDYFKFEQEIPFDTTTINWENFNSYGNLFAVFRADTRNKVYFATTGFNAEFKALYAMPFSDGWTKEFFSNSLIFYAKYDHSFNIIPKLTLKPGIFLGGTLKKNNPPIQHWFGVGGLNDINYVDTFVPFTGVLFVQTFGYYSAIGRLKVQYNVYEKLYLTFRSDVGATADLVDDIIDPSYTMFGYGLTASYDSFIGPVEFTVMGSNINPSLSVFANIGFNF
jgi:NTE family protein